ncbi:acyltransferase [Dysgonomonas sp. 25]|uniref:acyltransferase family protein n=1 Tax=Dysgonomonas sp. 25 TaxID=2302933 RepID=UPI0013D6E358|nr:acyltransferase [Dysgonomonas sp. 25]NDV68281.1 acyltransferase [Dysgonomonas sp. 25]
MVSTSTSNCFGLLSKYRTELMGISVIWIMLFHGTFHVDINFFPVKIGFAGVDIFFMLSGFGLYFASLKKPSLLKFYKSRFIRIFPVYAVVILLYFALKGTFDIKEYLLILSTVGFWTGEVSFEWFVPSIVVFYLGFPLYIKIFRKYPNILTILAILGPLAFIIMTVLMDINLGLKVLFFTRIPIFFVGVWLAKQSQNTTTPLYSKPQFRIALYILSLIGFAVLYYIHTYVNAYWLWKGLYWLPILLIAPGLSICLCQLLDKISSIRLSHILVFFGSISLELYLLHERIFYPYIKPWTEKLGISEYLVLLMAGILSIICAYLLHKSMNFILGKLKLL